MDADKLNKWLALGANCGVLIGLFLLIIEIQQNTDTMRAEMGQARSDNRIESFQSRAFSEHWPRLMASRNDFSSIGEWYESLSAEDYERVRYFYLGVVNEMVNTAYQCEEGYLDMQQCNAMRAQLIRILPEFPYVTFNMEASRGPFFEVLQELGQKDASLPLLLDDGSWLLPAQADAKPFGKDLRHRPRISGSRSDRIQ